MYTKLEGVIDIMYHRYRTGTDFELVPETDFISTDKKTYMHSKHRHKIPLIKTLCVIMLTLSLTAVPLSFSVHAESYPTLSTVSSSGNKTSAVGSSSGTSSSSKTSSSTSSSNTIATTSKMIIQKASGSQSLSLEEARQWKPETQTSRQKEFIVNVTSGTNRIEVFYTAGKNTPRLQFTSTSGKNIYTSQKDEMSADNNFKFITRANLSVEGFDNMRYMVIYISNTSDPGKWHLKVTLPDTLTEIACVTTDVPDGWETFNSDMRCLATDLWFWYCDSSKSEYKDDPIKAFNKMWVADGKLADVDNISSEEPEPEDNTAKIMMFAFVIFIFAVAGMGTMIYLRKKNDIERIKQKKREIAERENDKLKRKKGRENDILDKVLDDYSSDYVDEDEYADYFKRDDEQERGFRNDDEPLIFGRTGVSGTNPNSACIKPTAATEIYNEAVSATAEMVQKMMNNDNVTFQYTDNAYQNAAYPEYPGGYGKADSNGYSRNMQSPYVQTPGYPVHTVQPTDTYNEKPYSNSLPYIPLNPGGEENNAAPKTSYF